jgi:hypothetical protein
MYISQELDSVKDDLSRMKMNNIKNATPKVREIEKKNSPQRTITPKKSPKISPFFKGEFVYVCVNMYIYILYMEVYMYLYLHICTFIFIQYIYIYIYINVQGNLSVFYMANIMINIALI